MPADYEKPEYKSNKEKYEEAVRKAPPPNRVGQRLGDSDHVKLPQNQPKEKPQR